MPTPGVALIIRPKFDTATDYGHYYMGLAAEAMRARMRVADLAGAQATVMNADAILEEEDPIFCYFLGHGNADTFTLQNQAVWMRTCTGNEKLIGRNVLFLSCSVGIRLGPDTANKGALAVHCYDVDWTWIASGPPDTDIYAPGFFEAVNEIAIAHSEGALPSVAHARSLAVWNKWIDFWASSTDPYASMVIQHMVNDRDGQRLFGQGGQPSTPPGGGPGDGQMISEMDVPLAIGNGLLLLAILI